MSYLEQYWNRSIEFWDLMHVRGIFLSVAGMLLLSNGMFGGDPLKQGLVDLLMEFMDARYPDRPQADDLLYVSVQRQQLIHVNQGRSVGIYPISTAKAGLGGDQDSFRTPTGLHRVSEKIGDGVPAFGILKDREFTGAMADPDFADVDKDRITSRLLWLEGLEPGVNQGHNFDSHERYIYIHGTANERTIGTASSMGCVRMLNADIIQLFDSIPVGTLVVILDN